MIETLTSINNHPISNLGFGTMQFGDTADFATSSALFDHCRTAEINHFDCATLYAGGKAEEFLGKLIKPRRETVIISTKIGYHLPDTITQLHDEFTQSQKRLDCDVIDLLYLHRYNPKIQLSAQIELLVKLQQTQKIRYIGLSNFAAWQVMKAQNTAVNLGLKIHAIQPMYSLIKRQAEVELLPMCASENIQPITYSPLGSGLLSGKYLKNHTGRLSENQRYNARYAPGWMHQAAKNLCEIAQNHQIDPVTLAIIWAKHHPSNPIPLISARHPDQLKPALDASAIDIDPELYDQLSKLTPTPPPATDRLEEHG